MRSTTKHHWIIDPGHWQNTPGKRSPVFPGTSSQLLEWIFNWSLAMEMAKRMHNAGLEFTMMRLTQDGSTVREDVEDRVRFANSIKSRKPMVYISLHADAYGDGSTWTAPNGFTVFHAGASKTGKELAQMFHNNLHVTTGFKSRGVRPGNYYVLENTKMPAILIEHGFMTNLQEARELSESDMRSRIAIGHIHAMLDWEKTH